MPENKDQQDELKPIDADFAKGFNDGYLLMEQMPELAKSVEKALEQSTSGRSEGFKCGIMQFERDQIKTPVPEWMKDYGVDDVEPDHDIDLDIDKDDIDLERG